MSPASVRTTTPPCEIRRSPIRLSPVRLPTRVCRRSLAPDEPLEIGRVAEHGQPIADERLAQGMLEHADRRVGVRRDPLAHDLLGDLEGELDEVALTRGERLLARLAHLVHELLGHRQPLEDGGLGTRDALVVADLEPLLPRALGDRLGLLARDGDHRGALLAGPLEELVEPGEVAGPRPRRGAALRLGRLVRGCDDGEPATAGGLRAGDDRSFGH